MCECCGSGCQNPDKREEKPEACSPEQIEECHGTDAGHPCAEGKA